MVMQAIELLGLITIVGLLFTAEQKNHGVSQAITAAGAFHKTIAQGIGPN